MPSQGAQGRLAYAAAGTCRDALVHRRSVHASGAGLVY
jgi:hypothetical protein